MKLKTAERLEPDDDAIPFDLYIGFVKDGTFTDYDGFGHYSDGVFVYPDEGRVIPSDLENIKDGFAFIVWYNR